MRFRVYIKEIDARELGIVGNPDQFYGKKGAVCWMYWPPRFFWGNPKDGYIYDHKKIITTEPDLLTKMGTLTHGTIVHLVNYYSNVKVPHRLHQQDFKVVKGRSLNGKHAVYGVVPSGINWELFCLGNNKYQYMVKKSIDIADKLKI